MRNILGTINQASPRAFRLLLALYENKHEDYDLFKCSYARLLSTISAKRSDAKGDTMDRKSLILAAQELVDKGLVLRHRGWNEHWESNNGDGTPYFWQLTVDNDGADITDDNIELLLEALHEHKLDPVSSVLYAYTLIHGNRTFTLDQITSGTGIKDRRTIKKTMTRLINMGLIGGYEKIGKHGREDLYCILIKPYFGLVNILV